MSKRQPVEFHRSEVRFIAEQDGPVEQEFQRRLIDVLRNYKSITRAYLAAIDYGTPDTFTAALCLRALSGPDTELVKSIGNVFASIFSSAEHLDIVFIDEQQDIRVGKVCRAFYESGS
jgi:hypothetical protein